MESNWKPGVESLGRFIRSQRRLANLTLREMAELAKVSNPYLSQIERGLHEPSVRVLRSIASALNLSAETLLVHAGLIDQAPGPDADAPQHPGDPIDHARPRGAVDDDRGPRLRPTTSAPPDTDDDRGPRRAPARASATETAIRLDAALNDNQKEALLAVYRSFSTS